METEKSYSLVIDFFINDNEYSVMLADFSSGELIEDTKVTSLDMLDMLKEVEERKSRFHIAQLENYVFDINYNQVYSRVVEIN